MRKKNGGFCTVAMAVAAFFFMASFASAAVDSVRCILWQGDTNKYHTAISGEASVDPLDAWKITSDNELQVVYPGGSTYVSWIRAVVTVGGSSSTYCLYDYAGGSCTEENLCSALYSAGAFNQSVTIPAGPRPDSIVFEIVNTCGSGQTYEAFLNGTSMGVIEANTSAACTCTPGVQVSVPGKSESDAALLKGVITTTATNAIWYKWIFGDGEESSVTQLSGAKKYNVEILHTYVGAVGTPFTAQLMVDGIDNTMTHAVSDNYLVKIEQDNLDSQVNIAIDKGLWRLYTWMTYSDGVTDTYLTYNSQPCAIWGYSSFYASPTASAIQAFMINNHKETGNPAEDPYVEAARWGMNWLLNGNLYSSYPMLRAVSISTQHGSDNPDANSNTYGIEVSDYGYRPIYEGGMIMDAIVASGTPGANSGRDFDGNGAPDTYGQILQDMSDMYAYGQCDSDDGNGSYYGGWRYGWGDWPDNSACQWAAIGMIPAQHAPWNCTVPNWVKTYNNTWLNYSFYPWDSGTIEYGGFGYTSASYGDALTPSGMVQLDFDGATTSDQRWVRCERWLADSWSTWKNSGNMYAYYALAKAMRLAKPAPVETFASNGFNWYRDTTSGLALQLVKTQQKDGSWTDNGWTGNGSLATAWGVIILKPALFAAAPYACFTAHPNPSYPDHPIIFAPSCSGHTETGKTINNLKKFEWDFDNDGTYDESTTAPVEVTHSFSCASLPCTYPVTLRVTDDSDPALTATYTLDIRITNPPHPPVANAGGPYVVSLCADDTLTLDGSASYDPDEGQHEAGCTTCPNDTVTAWDWDLVPPPTQFNDQSGKTVMLDASAIASYFTSGAHQIGLQVTDNTAAAYPNSGQPNLKDANFSQVTVYDACGVCNLSAVIGCKSVDLSWGVNGAYSVLRSTEGPNSGFTKIGDATGTAYSDGTVVDGTTYYYRLMGNGCMSSSVMIAYVFEPGLCACVDNLAARAKLNKIQLTWTHTGADSYDVYRGMIAGGPYVFIANTTSTYSTYLDTGLAVGRTYYYVVREVRSGHETCQSNEASARTTAR